MSLSMQAVDVMIYIEQIYHESGDVPTNEKLAEVTGVGLDTIRNYWQNEDFRKALQARGIVADCITDTKALTYAQLMMANMLMNPTDKRSLRDKVKDPSVAAFDLTVQQVQGWMRSGFFQDHLRKRGQALYAGAEPAAYKNFVSAIEAGDQKAITQYFEMKGIYNPRVNIEVNVSMILARIVEIVTRHVKDPVTLQCIATELDGLDLGGQRGLPEMVETEVLAELVDVPVVSSKTQFII